ncbi:hypothetical protein ACEPAH_6246 [Sanghuangporus vaninii]
MGGLDDVPLFLLGSEGNNNNSNGAVGISPRLDDTEPGSGAEDEQEGGTSGERRAEPDGGDDSDSSSSSDNSSSSSTDNGLVEHEEGCERCVKAGRVCQGYPGQACMYCRTVAQQRCKLAMHGRAARRLQNKQVECRMREARQRVMAQVLRMPVTPVLEVDDLEELVMGMDESAVYFRMAALERHARVLFHTADQLRNLAEEMLAETSALGRVVRGE